jgi:hypothetical protein
MSIVNSGPLHHRRSDLVMKPLLIACLIGAAATAASAQTRSPERIIRDDGALVLTDGASYYRFKRDSSFDSGPLNGLSGRTITGRWRQDDDRFIIEGRFGWLNGLSAVDDYRRMTMRIQRIDGPGTGQPLLLAGTSVRVQRGYYTIDEMVRIPRPTWATRMGSVSPQTLRSDSARPTNREIHIRTYAPGVADIRWRVEDNRCALEIDYRATFSASAPPSSQVWLLRIDGTVITPTRAAVVTGVGFPGAGPPKVSYLYDRAVEHEAVAVVVKLGEEYVIEPLRR